MEDKIISAILAYLDQEVVQIDDEFGVAKIAFTGKINAEGIDYNGLLAEIAREMSAFIIPAIESCSANWDFAPEWANWLATNNAGVSQWFEDKPIWDNNRGVWQESTEDGRFKFASRLGKKTLLQRPG